MLQDRNGSAFLSYFACLGILCFTAGFLSSSSSCISFYFYVSVCLFLFISFPFPLVFHSFIICFLPYILFSLLTSFLFSYTFSLSLFMSPFLPFLSFPPFLPPCHHSFISLLSFITTHKVPLTSSLPTFFNFFFLLVFLFFLPINSLNGQPTLS